jgi:surface protein
MTTRQRRKTNLLCWRLLQGQGQLQVQVILVLLLAELTQVHHLVDGAGLRGTSSELPLWRSSSMQVQVQVPLIEIATLSTSTSTSTITSTRADGPVTSDALVCSSNNWNNNNNNKYNININPCPSSGVNRTLPVCLYHPDAQDYKTVCVKTTRSLLNEETAIVPLPASARNDKFKAFCGVCKRCFQDRDELRAAIDKYQSNTRVHVDLAETYGWPIGSWCVDKVTSFSNLFFRKSHFNEDLSSWKTSQVTDMTAMFQNAYEFNQPLDTWQVSQVTAMQRMFAMGIAFNQPLSSWNVHNVQDMGYLFLHAKVFNQDLSMWQVHNAQNLKSMFYGAHSFPLHYLDQWQINQQADTENMCSWDNNNHTNLNSTRST